MIRCVLLFILTCSLYGDVFAKERANRETVDTILELLTGIRPYDTRVAVSPSISDVELNARHKSKLNKKTVCDWSEGAVECVPSRTSISYLLEKSTSKFSLTTCESFRNKKDCGTVPGCLWDMHAGYCFFGSFDVAKLKSPCYEAARGFSTIIARRAPCIAESKAKSCFRDETCVWTERKKDCKVDPLRALYDIKTDEYTEVSEMLTMNIIKLIHERADVTKPDFDWELIFSTQPPEGLCDEIEDKKTCNFTKTVSEVIIRRAIYCELRYQERKAVEECKLDPLCQYHERSEECRERTTLHVLSTFVEKGIDFMASPVDREIMQKVLDCGWSVRQPALCTGTCTWDDTLGFCSIDASWAFKRIAEAGGTDTSDPFCGYFSAYGMSGCGPVDDPEECNALENCAWNQADIGCDMTVDYTIRQALERDDQFRTNYLKIAARCDTAETKGACSKIGSPKAIYVT